MTGLITTYFSSKLYGFIQSDEPGNPARFFHASNFTGTPVPVVGMRVSFVLAPPTKLGKPMQCANVRPESVGGGAQ